MGINLSEASKEEHTRFGDHYWSIDFYPNEHLSGEEYKKSFDSKSVSPVLGLLQIGKHRIPITHRELQKLSETINDAIHTMNSAYNSGYLK